MTGEGQGLVQLAAAGTAFVGTHLLLSNPLRRPMVRALGEPAFLAVYSVIALLSLGWLVVAFARMTAGPALWDGTALLPWLVASLLTVLAAVLFVASFNGNPALPGARMLAGLSARKPWGVFRVTRHPMMMAFALWAVAHVLISPTLRSLLLCAAIGGLALGGAALQDRRKLATTGREWGVWQQRTSFWPRLRRLPEIGTAWLIGIALWLAVTFAHLPLLGRAAGIWPLMR